MSKLNFKNNEWALLPAGKEYRILTWKGHRTDPKRSWSNHIAEEDTLVLICGRDSPELYKVADFQGLIETCNLGFVKETDLLKYKMPVFPKELSNQMTKNSEWKVTDTIRFQLETFNRKIISFMELSIGSTFKVIKMTTYGHFQEKSVIATYNDKEIVIPLRWMVDRIELVSPGVEKVYFKLLDKDNNPIIPKRFKTLATAKSSAAIRVGAVNFDIDSIRNTTFQYMETDRAIDCSGWQVVKYDVNDQETYREDITDWLIGRKLSKVA